MALFSLFVSFFFFNNFFVLFLMFFFFIFSIFLNFFWSGLFFFFDSFNYFIISFMSVLIMGFIMVSENNKALIFYSNLVVFFSFCFFFSGSIFFLYVFYELTMVPIIFSLLGYGMQVEKTSASYYLVFYTLFFSFPFLFVFSQVNYFFNFVYYDFFISFELTFFLVFCFLVKFPIYFVHVWLPKAHVEAPTSVSMILAGVMLKLGGVGVFRINSLINFFNLEIWIFLSFISMVFCSFICSMQSDMKSLAAYSSICHMGFVFLSEVSMLYYGKSMSLLMMLSHGYVSVMMFYLIGEFFHVSGNRLIYYMRGCFNVNVIFSLFFCLVFMFNFSFPFTISFFSEYFLLNYFSGLFIFSLFFLLLYYLVSFYYSIFMIVYFLTGKIFFSFFDGHFYFVIVLIFLSYNFLFLFCVI
uniref:NADH dehydrogenase subunit 4 n=1 Tax=Metathelazia capsulata TaxID=2964486 RepID=UPI002E7955F6|nr:NADH dehydrogenase subunit 4 [Metathelazia capsulata]WPS93541.1 NADH dehydrogenase subunit 4 [Metathelazia capsulata]